MEGNCNNFVESTVQIQEVRDAVEYVHTHPNKPLLDSLTSDGSAIKYLAEDGKYHEFPPMFFVSAFLESYDELKGNVKAFTDDNQKLYLNTINTFASRLDGKVVGKISVSNSITNKQIATDISEVDVNSGDITKASLSHVGVDSGLKISYENGLITLRLALDEAPFINLISRVPSASENAVATFTSDGQIKDSGFDISDLATVNSLQTHIDNSQVHVTQAKQDEWSAKQNALTTTQLDAVNSGITAAKVQTYDNYETRKLNVANHPATKNVVTDANGNITTEDKFDHTTQIDKVANATVGAIPLLTQDGGLSNSQVQLGSFPVTKTLREYLDDEVYEAISGSSYQGLYTFFGDETMVRAATAQNGDTALVYVGSPSQLGGLLKGAYDGTDWTFENLIPVPGNGAWFEIDHLLTVTPNDPGRIIVHIESNNPPSLDVRLDNHVQLDNSTVTYDAQGQVTFKMKSLTNNKSVLNSTTADNIAVDNTAGSNTIAQELTQIKSDYELAFTKNTAFNKNFDTSHQTANSTMVIGDQDTRLSDARPASDVYAWAKEATKPSYTPSEVGALPVRPVTDVATQNSTDLFTSGGAFNLEATKQNNIVVSASAPLNPVEGDIWFQINGNGSLTLNRFNGSTWDSNVFYTHPDPYICVLGDVDNVSEGNIAWSSYDSSTHLSSATIPYSVHGKGAITTGGNTIYVPRIRMFAIDNSILTELNESPKINMSTGAITVYTSSTSLATTPFIMLMVC